MRRHLKTFAAALTAAGLSAGMGAAASAADLPPAYAKAPIAPAYNWTGCYAGVHAGGGLIESFFVEGSLEGAGGLGGGQLGCNYQTGQFVFGVEGEGAWASITDRSDFIESGSSRFETIRNRWDTDLSLRVGFAFDRALIYGKTGAAIGSFEFKDSESRGNFTDGRSTLAGLLLGAGIEYGFTPSWTAKLEYDFIGFADKDVFFNTNFGPETFTTGAKKQIVKVGVNYRFGN